jgi:spore coat protein CotH
LQHQASSPYEICGLNEALAYDLYRAAGNASQRAGYMRVVMDGKLVGHHLWFEQPNGGFFRHNDIDDGGNLYKVIWQGGNTASPYTPEEKLPKRRSDIVGRHEKKSNPHGGYEDLIALIEKLETTSGDDAMWTLIQEQFDVDQVANYFAVNSLISHWDGFFNNYFLYHDTKRKKWTMYPLDQDSTWSQRGGRPDELYEMPLNFGAEDAQRPGSEDRRDRDQNGGRERGGRGGFGGFGRGGAGWWRPGGEISKPLLANPQFRDRFFARLKSICETSFSEDVFGSKIDSLGESLKQEVVMRAQAHGQNDDEAAQNLSEIISSLKEHVVERRSFVLEQLNESN